MIEDPRALLTMPKIIQSLSSLRRMVDFFPLEAAIFGSDDYCAKIGATRSKEGGELAYARQHFVACCKAYGLQAIDAVFIDYKDAGGLKEQSERGRRTQLQFTAQSNITPIFRQGMGLRWQAVHPPFASPHHPGGIPPD